jgi:hypothetical protein
MHPNPSELVTGEPISLATWNYDASVAKVNAIVLRWRDMTTDLLEELLIARDALSTGGRPKGDAHTWVSYCEDIGVEKRTANLWLERYESGKNYPLLDSGKPHVAQATGENEWYTPGEYIEAARTVLGNIELDPASTEEADAVVRAQRYYSIEDDGLSKDWRGRIWLNPPYASDLVGKFTAKLCRHYEMEDVSAALVLVNNATETEWFQQLAWRASAICFPERRVKFWGPNGATGAPLQGQAIVYLGANLPVFRDRFEKFGLILYGQG